MDVVIIAWMVLHMNIRCYSNFVNIARYSLWINYLMSKSIWLCIMKQIWMVTMNISSEKQVVLGLQRIVITKWFGPHWPNKWPYGLDLATQAVQEVWVIKWQKVGVFSKELEVLREGSWWEDRGGKCRTWEGWVRLHRGLWKDWESWDMLVKVTGSQRRAGEERWKLCARKGLL